MLKYLNFHNSSFALTYFLHKFHPFNFTLFLLESFTLGKKALTPLQYWNWAHVQRLTALPAALREPFLIRVSPLT
jgi:hypothetical protein